MTSSSQFLRMSTSTFLTAILWERWDRVERRPWEGVVWTKKKWQGLKLFEIIPSEEVHTNWEVRIYKATRFLEARTRRADTGGRRLSPTDLDWILTSLPSKLRRNHRKMSCVNDFSFSHSMMGTRLYKRTLSAQYVVKRHHQTSYITTSSESEF